MALKKALEDVNGAPDKFDVIGFDACLMSAVGSADEYHEVAKYLLASEPVEPGHGKNLDLSYHKLHYLYLWLEYSFCCRKISSGVSSHQV